MNTGAFCFGKYVISFLLQKTPICKLFSCFCWLYYIWYDTNRVVAVASLTKGGIDHEKKFWILLLVLLCMAALPTLAHAAVVDSDSSCYSGCYII